MKNIVFCRFVDVLMKVLTAAGIVSDVLMPWIARALLTRFGDTAHTVPVAVSLMIAGIPAIIILFELSRVMDTVVKGDCFVDGNVRSLQVMSVCGFLVAAVMTVRLFILPTVSAIVIAAVFFIAGLFAGVLSLVFREAVRYKKENDLTI